MDTIAARLRQAYPKENGELGVGVNVVSLLDADRGRSQARPSGPDGGSRLLALDRLRERRQPDAGARHNSQAGICAAAGDGRQSLRG